MGLRGDTMGGGESIYIYIHTHLYADADVHVYVYMLMVCTHIYIYAHTCICVYTDKLHPEYVWGGAVDSCQVLLIIFGQILFLSLRLPRWFQNLTAGAPGFIIG